ncbi:MAG TPA: ACT domain-containing protein [Vicinamibacterales bacterium]|nr:ACT domain-containing protein [Vicinamibacterales bacterium]
MAIHKEITVRLANSPGTISRVAQVLGAERINMLAMTVEPSGALRMVVDNPLHAAATLREQHYQVEECDVLYTSMPNEPGSLARALKLLADAGINVEYAYASGIDRLPMVGVVIGVNDAQRASYATGI